MRINCSCGGPLLIIYRLLDLGSLLSLRGLSPLPWRVLRVVSHWVVNVHRLLGFLRAFPSFAFFLFLPFLNQASVDKLRKVCSVINYRVPDNRIYSLFRYIDWTVSDLLAFHDFYKTFLLLLKGVARSQTTCSILFWLVLATEAPRKQFPFR